MNNVNYKHSEITEKIINCFYKVYNKLGYGFFETVYEKALLIELSKLGYSYKSQEQVKVYYDEQIVGIYKPDVIVEGLVVIENKAAITIHPTHEDQLKNALRSTEMEVGLLLNFGLKPEFRKKVFANEFKKNLPKVNRILED